MDVSIIVPIYNVEKYLKECLDSLLDQTLEVIEVLLINDGTTDSSGIIAKEYADKYPNLFTYLEKPNGGLSDARNFGMSFAKGEYIAFVDSDDYIAPTMFEKLYNVAKTTSADIVECEFECVFEETGKHLPIKFHAYKNKQDCLMVDYPNAWNKIYRKEWLDSLSVEFPKGLWHEDIEFFFKVLPFANMVPVTVHEPLYYYRQRSGSIMSKPDRRILDLHKIYANIIAYYKDKGLLDEYKEAIEYKYLKTTCCNFMKRMLAINDRKFRDDVIDESWKLFNNAFPEWRKNTYLKEFNFINLYLCLMSKPFIKILKLLTDIAKNTSNGLIKW